MNSLHYEKVIKTGTRLIIQYKFLVIIIVLFFFGVASSGLRFLEFSSNGRVFFQKNDPELLTLEALEKTYSKDNNVLFAIAPKDSKSVFSRKTLTAISEFTEILWETPFSSRVDSITNFQHTRGENNNLVVENLVENASDLTNEQIRKIRNIAFSEPQLVNNLLAPSGNVTGINVTVMLPEKSEKEISEVVMFARNRVSDFKQKYPQLDVYLVGGVIFSNALAEASQSDMKILIPLMFIIMILIVFFSLRSISGTFITVLIIATSVTTAMGLAGWCNIKITSASSIAPTIICTLAIADSIHILNTFFYFFRQGKSKNEALIDSLCINIWPVFLTSITSAIGFLSMNGSDAPPFHDLGNIVAVGVVFAFIYSILLIPALVAALPVKIKLFTKDETNFMDNLGEFVVREQKPLLLGMTALIVGLIAGLPQIELNDNFLKYFDERFQFRQDADFVEQNLSGGMNLLEFSLDSGESGGINNPEYLSKVDEFATWFRKQPRVKHVSSITAIIKRLNRDMHNDNPDYFRIPENRSLSAQYLMLYEMCLPFGMDINNRINLDKSESRFTVQLENLSSQELLMLGRKGEMWLKRNMPGQTNIQATGFSLLFANIAKKNIYSMLGSTLMALVLISGLLIIAFRSLRIGLISLLPNLIPAMMAFGLWGFLIGRVNLAVSVVAAMSLGLVVDDTVYFLSKYLYAKRGLGKSPSGAIIFTFHTVGKGIFSTSIILVGGFLILSQSGFGVNSSMGFLTAITICFAFIADFFFLPPLLLLMDKNE